MTDSRTSTGLTSPFAGGLLVGGAIALGSVCMALYVASYATGSNSAASGRSRARAREASERDNHRFSPRRFIDKAHGERNGLTPPHYYEESVSQRSGSQAAAPLAHPELRGRRSAAPPTDADADASAASDPCESDAYAGYRAAPPYAMPQPALPRSQANASPHKPPKPPHRPSNHTNTINAVPFPGQSPHKAHSAPASQPSARSMPGGNPPLPHGPAFHVTTLTRDDGKPQPPPPPHMLLQNGAPMPAGPAGGAKTGLQGLTTIEQSDPKDQGRAIEVAAVNEEYCRVITAENSMTTEDEAVCHNLVQSLDLRWKWLFRPKLSAADLADEPEVARPSELRDHFAYSPLPRAPFHFKLIDGVYRVFHDAACSSEAFPLPGTDKDFFTDMLHLLRVGAAGPVKTYCHHRLVLLEQKFNLHVMVNADKEYLAQKTAPHRDFYNVRKVDTHVHHSACMHQKHLLRFIKSKLKKESDEIVIFRDGKFLTLREVFESLNLTAYDLNVDTLDMHADKTIFHRFDKFNLKYNPFGQSRLREIFIKQDNLLHGRFLAELTQEVFSDLEETKYQHTEYRISIYGRKAKEWDILAAWVCQNKLYSDNNVWLIQVPRLYNIYKAQGLIENFEQMLENLFQPLFEVTLDSETHPQLHIFLQQVVGFDMVDDESKPERKPTKNMPKPAEWSNKYNPAYSYYAFYIYANIYTLNKLREERGLNTFTFRPHAGEAGEIDHLASAFMLCDNIAHGINLRKSPFLQYIYYLAQVGLCMSPLSNNSLFLDYHRNPFPMYFARGLSVSLSTDDPLQIHLTKEPLVEEFSVAANMWKLSTTDLCEVARYGVLHSGFPHACKKHWVGEHYWKPGPEGNDIQKTNVPNLRMRFRFDTHQEEMRLLYLGAMEHVRQGNRGIGLD